MMTDTKELLSLLSRAFGAPVDLVSEEVQSDGQTLITWSKRLPKGEIRLSADPRILVSSDQTALRWVDGQPRNTFSMKDLAEADPAVEANRHPQTKALADRLAGRLREVNLVSSSGAVALITAFRHLEPESSAALIASATRQNFWDLMRHAQIAHEYRFGETPAPYSDEEYEIACRVVAEPWFTKALQENGQIHDRNLYLPVVANEKAGVF